MSSDLDSQTASWEDFAMCPGGQDRDNLALVSSSPPCCCQNRAPRALSPWGGVGAEVLVTLKAGAMLQDSSGSSPK